MNPWIILAIVLFWLASLLGAEQYGNHARGTKDDLKYQKRDNKTLSDANAKILELTTKYDAEHAAHEQAIAAADAKLFKERKDAQDITNQLISAARDGRLQFIDTASTDSGGSKTEAIANSPGGSNAAQGSKLSGTSVAFLLNLTGEADDTARQLTACQAIVVDDRK